METGESSGAKPKTKLSTYLWLGVLFLFLLDLTSSIDSSFVYFFLGLSAFMFFMAFREWFTGRSINFGNYKREEPRESDRTQAHPPENPFNQRQQRTQQPQQAPVASASKATARKILFIFLGIFAILFTLPIVISILSSDDYDQDAAFYYQSADQYFYSGQYDSARISYRRALRIQPEYVEALKGYGKTLLAQKEYDSALIMFDKFLEVDPTDREAAYNKGQVYFNQQQYDMAIKQAESILTDEPEYYDAMLLAGDCYYSQKQYDPALEWYQKAYDNDVKNASLCWVMAYIYDEKGNMEKAIPLYKETLSYDSSNVEIYTRLGQLLPEQEGNFFRTKAAQLQQLTQ